jgi:multisubunit Na+/H+ antiporter MnhB subunit
MALTTANLLRRYAMATRKRSNAKSAAKVDIESLEAYTAQPIPPTDYTPHITAVAIGLTALGLAGFGLVANASFMVTSGAPGFQAVVLCGLGVAIEVLAFGLPTLATLLSPKDRHSATIAWCIWGLCVTLVLINSCGFSSRYIGDGVFAREQVTDERSNRKDELAALKTQRSAIKELRSVAELDTLISNSRQNALYSHSEGCSKIMGVRDRDFCKALQASLLGRTEASSRDTLDGKIAAFESALASAPAIALADPGATVAADMLGWLTRGEITPSVHDFQTLRIIILTVLPAFAGPLLGLAMRLWRA